MAVAAKKAAARKPAAKKPGITRMEVEFTFVRETSGTFRFDEDAEKGEHLIGGLYLKKSQLDGTKPARLKVTIDVLEEQAE